MFHEESKYIFFEPLSFLEPDLGIEKKKVKVIYIKIIIILL